MKLFLIIILLAACLPAVDARALLPEATLMGIPSDTSSGNLGIQAAYWSRFNATESGDLDEILFRSTIEAGADYAKVALYGPGVDATHPGALLTLNNTSAQFFNGVWNVRPVPAVGVTEGTTYWIAIVAGGQQAHTHATVTNNWGYMGHILTNDHEGYIFPATPGALTADAAGDSLTAYARGHVQREERPT